MFSQEDSENDSGSEESIPSDAELESLIMPPFSEEALPAGENAMELIAGNMSINDFLKTSKPKTKYSDPVYSSMIGQANLSLARRNFKEALSFCERAIRLGPYDPAPYQIMSEVYEECDEHDKALKLGMIAASLGKDDAETWIALGEKAVDLELVTDAIFCYQKTLRSNPRSLHVYETLLKLMKPETDKKSIIVVYQKLIQNVAPEAGAEILKHARTGAGILVAENDLPGALVLMETAFENVPGAVTFDDVNLIVELYLGLQKFKETLEVISKFCDVDIEGEEDLIADTATEEVSHSVLRVVSCTIKGELPIQIRSKLVIALIRLKALHLVDSITMPILPQVEDYGDVLMDIVDVCMAESHYDEALKILKVMTSSKNFNLPQVWLLYAECLKNVNRKEEAVSAYLTVMNMAPQLAEARLIVSELLNDLGRSDEALTALTQDPNSEFLDYDVLHERCLLLKDNHERTDEFLVAGRLLLSSHCERFRTRQEFVVFMRANKYRRTQRDPKLPPRHDVYEMLLALCKVAFETKQFALLQRLACTGLSSKIIMNPTDEKEVMGLTILAAFFNRDSFTSNTILKHLIHNGHDNNRIWNVFNLLMLETEDVPQQKFLMRLLKKRPSHSALSIIFANHCFISGSYKQALSEYLLQFKNQPHPLQALLIAITFLQIALQKHTTSINAIVTQAMGYISEYRHLRSEEALQETHYNLGRLTHQLNMLPTAIHHYKMVLETPALAEMFDLKREAAYNLSLIYKASNYHDLARYYIEKYIVIE